MRQTLGIVGNCSYSALLTAGSVEWLWWPRPDSSFVFGPLCCGRCSAATPARSS